MTIGPAVAATVQTEVDGPESVISTNKLAVVSTHIASYQRNGVFILYLFYVYENIACR